MSKFLDPQRAASKTTRKSRQQAATPGTSVGTDRIIASLHRSLGKDAKKAEDERRKIERAVQATTPELIAAMDEEFLADFFFALEQVATSANRKQIEKHPLRPDVVDELHEDARAAEADGERDPAASQTAADFTPRGDAGEGRVEP